MWGKVGVSVGHRNKTAEAVGASGRMWEKTGELWRASGRTWDTVGVWNRAAEVLPDTPAEDTGGVLRPTSSTAALGNSRDQTALNSGSRNLEISDLAPIHCNSLANHASSSATFSRPRLRPTFDVPLPDKSGR
ncbi:hypothetical protein SJAG_01932 [Schizosaccharomyces japonicus yFS275]|uniref:Uncharacterized protein n=1 Tax=Schizosaccharomyces japonicus (strain yFS275 / FY16936) TaxID=402676 RepID=B6JZA4_SCHJY|nr:hypothetical protein SJAG_01932 [Schizosaccharomyces japonicus yFS275]EEB06872.1 hypothetical protein SJAG_01932 [Schizosaccharomyces japonicus yFS275]